MLQINDLEVVKNKRIVLRVPQMVLPESSINALIGGEKTGKSLLAATIHGFYTDYRGIIDFQNINKKKINSYLLTNEVVLLKNKSVNDNFCLSTKDKLESINEYVLLAGLESDLDSIIDDLPYAKNKLVELSIACGLQPQVIIIDDFDKAYTSSYLLIAGKMLFKYKSEGGTVLLTSTLKIPEMDNIYSIDSDGVVKI